MGIMGGNKNPGKFGQQSFRPNAGQVQGKKPVVGSGSINIDRLKSMQENNRRQTDGYKLNPNGASRFRLIHPLGGDDVPMMTANMHWIPVIKDDGTPGRRPVYCYKQFGFRDCPVCALKDILGRSTDQAVLEDAEGMGVGDAWAAYVVNRDYLAGSDDLAADFDPRKDKVQLFSIKGKVADAILGFLQMRVWGDASHPETGYDFECVGKPTNQQFKGHSVSEYTLTPVPRDFSPAYDDALTRGLKPLYEVVKYASVEDLRKILDPLLITIQQSSEEGAMLMGEFAPLYNELLSMIVAGPGVDYESVRDGNPEIDGGEEYAEGENVQFGQDSEGNGEAPYSEVGEEDDGSGEGAEDPETGGEEGGFVADENGGQGEDPEGGEAAPAPQAVKAPRAAAPKSAPGAVRKPTAQPAATAVRPAAAAAPVTPAATPGFRKPATPGTPPARPGVTPGQPQLSPELLGKLTKVGKKLS